ncbi:MAG: metalloregulator ArsR/SmtB family transcription factor [Cyanobacteria bacterium CRU_2_1]|nr:metalloregulator ArsR/SmtB family transcription factor [Cyanobacteria bacterium RU_5_0]NJR60091.1 metalloregulator ArsR/SmtB family transcription factor [Cyanobacteria bacterium CRU_2_1]
MESPDMQTLLSFFKIMANGSRLKLVGVLAQRECSVEELATLLSLKEPTISHHLAKLRELGLVQMRPDRNTHLYCLDTDALNTLNKAMLTSTSIASLTDVEPEAWEKKVLRTYLEDNCLKKIPASHKKRWIILKWLVGQFEPDVTYPEKAVNEIIQQFHPDSATLRRELIDYQMMQRENGVYWRLPEIAWKTV